MTCERCFRIKAFVHFEPQRPFDQRLVLLEEQIVGIRPVYSTNHIYVAEPFGYQQRRSLVRSSMVLIATVDP